MRAIRLAFLLVGLAILCTGTAHADPAKPSFDVQGHRGARGLLPENTLAGFARALELGVTTLEIDVGITRDGKVIVAHDPYVHPELCLTPTGDRFAMKRGPLLMHLDLRELQAFDCGSLNPDVERFPEPPRVNLPGERMPALREVIALTRERKDERVRFNVEVKFSPENEDTVALAPFVAAVVGVLRAEGVMARATLQAFDWRVLAEAKRLAPELHTAALLYEVDPLWQAGLDAEKLGGVLGLLRASAASVDAFSPHWKLLVPGEAYAGHSVAEYQAAGFSVVPWTVNEREPMRRLIALGVDGIITDYPDRLLEVLRESRK